MIPQRTSAGVVCTQVRCSDVRVRIGEVFDRQEDPRFGASRTCWLTPLTGPRTPITQTLDREPRPGNRARRATDSERLPLQ